MAITSMGFDFGLESNGLTLDRTGLNNPRTCKRKFRWLVIIPEICSDGINGLPPIKSARPSISFKEMEARHLNENYYYPVIKPEWKVLPLTLYDLKKDKHPIFEWMRKVYDPETGLAQPSVYAIGVGQTLILPYVNIELYDGCGNLVERWILEDVWPTNIDFMDLDMNSVEVCLCDVQLRYARAYIEYATA